MMRLIAAKLTEDIESIKVIYEKNGKMYLRNGSDSFKTGVEIPNLNMFYKFGFKKIANPPNCNNMYEIQGVVSKMEIQPNGMINCVG